MTSQSYVSNNCKAIGIFNYYYMSSNIGAVLMAFALNYFLRDYYKDKYIIKNINYIPESLILDIERMMFQARTQSNEQLVREKFNNFRAKYIPDTKKYVSSSDLIQLNDEFSTFIVGADQVFNGNQNNLSILHANLLQFAHSNKNLIACAASFGDYDFRCDPDMFEFYFNSLSRFDSLSLREKSGVEMCSSVGLDSTHILDPVFFVDKQVYENIAVDFKSDKSHDIICYPVGGVFYNTLINHLKYISLNKNFSVDDVFEVFFDDGIEGWLYYLINCKLLITNSFHGVCFALIFNKNFVFVHDAGGSLRVKSLSNMLGGALDEHIFHHFSDVDFASMQQNIPNWNLVNEKLDILIKDSKNFLTNAIDSFADDSAKYAKKEEYQRKILDYYTRNYIPIINQLKKNID